MTTITLFASLLSLSLTFLVLWSNPRRFSNQVFAFILVLQTAWLACVYRAMQVGSIASEPERALALEWWFRANAIIIAFLPAALWLLYSSITAVTCNRLTIVAKALPVILLCIGSAGLCFTTSFITRDQSGILTRGISYYMFAVVGLSLYAACTFRTFRGIRLTTGIRQVELKFLALNSGGAALILLGLNALGNIINNRTYNRLSVLLVLSTSAITAGALLFHRVFNVKEVFFRFAHRIWFSCILSGGIYFVWRFTDGLITEPFGLLLSIAIFSPIAVWLDTQSRRWFDISGELKLAELRRTAITIAQSEVATDSLVKQLKHLLGATFGTDCSYFLIDQGNRYKDNTVSIAKDHPAFRAVCGTGWATPESLERRRPTSESEALGILLKHHDLGMIISIPAGSAKPSMFIALNKRADEAPYTFPEVERLQKVGELIDNVITRSQLTEQAALRARMEFLALMSRGLAHDLKNLITPISEFFIYNNGKYASGTKEWEIYNVARQSMQFITEYVHETLAFSKGLAPHFASVIVQTLCEAVVHLTSQRAKQRGIQLQVGCMGVRPMVADRVLIERMLANLVTNAIDASSAGQTVTLTVSASHSERVRFEVRDDGCGILPQNKSRIFDPYFTTKAIDNEARGIGLGLTIVSNIVLLHDGYINVQSQPGCPTIVSVELPFERTSGSQRSQENNQT